MDSPNVVDGAVGELNEAAVHALDEERVRRRLNLGEGHQQVPARIVHFHVAAARR